MLWRFFKIIQTLLFEERDSAVLWVIAFYAFGIMLYFSFNAEPNLVFAVIISLALFIVTLCARSAPALFWILLLACAISFGVTIPTIRVKILSHEIVKKKIDDVKITGVVEKIFMQSNGTKIQIHEPLIRQGDDQYRLSKIHVHSKSKYNDFSVGDLVTFYANLMPPSGVLFPDKYDFSRHIYFEKIASSGFVVSKIRVIEYASALPILRVLENIRTKIYKSIWANMGADIAAISTSLILGEQKSISSSALEAMRKSGLSHILSVSGMHLSIVSIICFFSVRYFLSYSTYISQRFNTKKFASVVSIAVTFWYLLISGLQVAAIRSFIMVAFVLLAVLLDREENAKRSVCFAAFFILLFTPEAVFHPGFQMSFAAVLALISFFEIYVKITSNNLALKSNGVFSKIIKYFKGVLLSSLIAGSATAMFVVYHFGNHSNYSILANLVAAPTVSLIIMPAIVFVFVLMPFGQEKIAFFALDKGVGILLKTASYFSSLKNSVVLLPPISTLPLALFVFGFLWLCLWKKAWRVFGAIPIACALLIVIIAPYPAMIIDAKYKNIIIRTKDGALLKVGGSRKISEWYETQWKTNLGSTDLRTEARGGSYSSTFDNYKFDAVFVDKKLEQILIDTGKNTKVVTAEDLNDSGSMLVYIRNGRINIKTAFDHESRRPWSIKK